MFFLRAGPAGEQVAVTVLARQEKAAQLGAKDAAFVNAVEFPGQKP